MANKPLKSISFPGLSDTYIVPQIDSTLGVAGAAADSKKVGDSLATKADINGSYDDLSVGNAHQLISNVHEEDSVPYLFRTSGGSMNIGDREEDMLVGGTMAWNQLVNTGSSSVTVQSGHKYYANINNVKSIAASSGTAIAINNSTKDNVHDLTQMFGPTIADYIYSLEQATTGAGVAWFRRLFPKQYYAYNTGQLMSVKAVKHVMTGFNQWDEEWEVGSIGNSGQPYTTPNAIRSKNFNPCIPNTTYYLWVPATSGVSCSLYFYDADKMFISNSAVARNTVTTPTNACYFKIAMNDAYGNTYNNDICLNLHWDGERDGEYEPYVGREYSLDSDLELRGVPKLDVNNKLYYDGDTYTSDGTVTRRYGMVDLGTLSWSYTNSCMVSGTLSVPGSVGEVGSSNNVICSKYASRPTRNYTTSYDNGLCGLTIAGNQIIVRDDNYSSTSDFKAAMSGVYFVYELAIPTTEEADTYQNPQIVDDWGTEEYVVDSTQEPPIPVGHVTKYQVALRQKLEMLPDSPDGDGDYILRQTNGINEFVPLSDRIPNAPTTNGTYVLKATVSGGSTTYTWASE